jgi:prepilin-type N-terminal cleavage/methylation domain-containing protein
MLTTRLSLPNPVRPGAAAEPVRGGEAREPRAGRGGRRPRRLLGEERGFTLIEVMVATFVLTVGVLGLFATLNVAARTTRLNRERQAETSLARDVIENALTLPYTQLTPQTLAGTLQPLIAGSSVIGQGLTVTGSPYPFNISVSSVCSLDDPTDGYGNHSNPPASGGAWCPDSTQTGTTDTNPDDEKRLTVIVTPRTGTLPTVQLSTLIYAQKGNGPAVSCLSLSQGKPCQSTNQTITATTTTSLTFYVTTTTSAQSIQWLVNGGPPSSNQIPTGATDPYPASGTTSQFTWKLPPADGTYTISAYAQDSLGNTGARSTLQIKLNRHPGTPPASVTAGYDQLISGGYTAPTGGVDIQWVPSIDQDTLYYNVYRQVASGAVTQVCSHVNGTSCTDMTAPDPGLPPTQCSSPPTDYAAQPNLYWVKAVDLVGEGAASATPPANPWSDANLCDHAPSPPSNLNVNVANGTATLNWSAPPSPQDIDPGDSILGWRIYRWASGGNGSYPGSRLAYVGAVNAGQTVTSFTDSSADPGGVVQSYCVTSVDTRLNESACSNTGSG